MYTCVHVHCVCAVLIYSGDRRKTLPLYTLAAGKQILVPHLKPECILNGRPGEHKQKKSIHGKHVEELNIPRQTTAKYCLMYTIKRTCSYKPQYVLPKWNADKSRKDERKKKKLHLLGPPAFEGTSVCAQDRQTMAELKTNIH